eukprot:1000176-Pyramimonas_sp.AAC.1
MREEASQPPTKQRKLEEVHAIGYPRSFLRNRGQSIWSNCTAKDGNHLTHRLEMVATNGDGSIPGALKLDKKADVLALCATRWTPLAAAGCSARSARTAIAEGEEDEQAASSVSMEGMIQQEGERRPLRSTSRR